MKDKIPISKMTSMKAWVLSITETTAVTEIRLIPIESNAMTLSVKEGPRITRYKHMRMEMAMHTKEICKRRSSISVSPP
jgi:hypothetical protein